MVNSMENSTWSELGKQNIQAKIYVYQTSVVPFTASYLVSQKRKCQTYPTSYLIPHTSWFLVNFCHPSVSSNVTVAFFPLLLDINECTTNVHNCDANAFCSNSEGSYNCTCSPGYTGNGTSCSGIYIIVYYLKKKVTNSVMPVWIFMLEIFERDRDLHSSTFGCVTIYTTI